MSWILLEAISLQHVHNLTRRWHQVDAPRAGLLRHGVDSYTYNIARWPGLCYTGLMRGPCDNNRMRQPLAQATALMWNHERTVRETWQQRLEAAEMTWCLCMFHVTLWVWDAAEVSRVICWFSIQNLVYFETNLSAVTLFLPLTHILSPPPQAYRLSCFLVRLLSDQIKTVHVSSMHQSLQQRTHSRSASISLIYCVTISLGAFFKTLLLSTIIFSFVSLKTLW